VNASSDRSRASSGTLKGVRDGRLTLARIKLKRMAGINHKEVPKLSRKANDFEKCDYRYCVGSIVVCEAYLEDGRSTGRSTGMKCPRCKK